MMDSRHTEQLSQETSEYRENGQQICRTISVGAASAIFLIVFILPGILNCLDGLTAGKHRLRK